MAKESKTVSDAMADLYAMLATVSARRAVDHVKASFNPREADKYIEATHHWLQKSSAQSIRWTYRKPSL